MHSSRIAGAIAVCTLAMLMLIACGDDDDNSTGSTSTPTATLAGSPTPSPNPLVPPLEGPERVGYIGERQDFRLNPDFELPTPNEVPTPEDTDDPVLNPPSVPDCPDDWKKLFRGPEGFQLCYPEDWSVLTDAYKNSPGEERWYTGGVFKFPGDPPEHQLAHVSIYAIPQYTRPFPYTKDCPTPYSVRLDNQPAVVCPSFPARHPEARLVSYHVFRENFDYFFNIALYYNWDESAGAFTDETDASAFDTAVRIIHSVEFMSVPTVAPAATGTQSP
jgi:hypothetical protein